MAMWREMSMSIHLLIGKCCQGDNYGMEHWLEIVRTTRVKSKTVQMIISGNIMLHAN